MRFKQYLQEEYVMNVKGTWSNMYSGRSDVFENPTAKEVQSLTRDIRFIVNFKTRRLYLWNWDITHTEIAEHLYKFKLIPSPSITDAFLKTCYAGLAEKRTGAKMKFIRNSDCVYNLSQYPWMKNNTDDSWLLPWFGESLIGSIKETYGIKK